MISNDVPKVEYVMAIGLGQVGDLPAIDGLTHRNSDGVRMVRTQASPEGQLYTLDSYVFLLPTISLSPEAKQAGVRMDARVIRGAEMSRLVQEPFFVYDEAVDPFTNLGNLEVQIGRMKRGGEELGDYPTDQQERAMASLLEDLDGYTVSWARLAILQN